MLRVFRYLFGGSLQKPAGKFVQPAFAVTGKVTGAARAEKLNLFGHSWNPAAAAHTASCECREITVCTAVSVAGVDAAAKSARPARKPSHLAARLRCTAKLNKNSARLHLSRKSQGKLPAVKRAPPLYPVKLKKITAKRAKTKIIVVRPKLKSAVILRFPVPASKAQALRHRRVA